MSYRLQEIDVTHSLPDLQLTEEHQGVALIVRRREKPIGFMMREVPPRSVITANELAAWIAQEIGTKLLQESIRDELIASLQPSKSFPSLTVAICTKDRPDNVARCLESLLPLQHPRASEASHFEIVVVDNAPSDDRTKAVIDALPTVTYVREPKPGLDFARNKAIATATGELLAFLDDDVVVDRQWLTGLQEAWAENPDAAAFTGLVLPYELVTHAQILFESRGGFRRGFEKIRYGQVLSNNPLYPCGAGIFGAGCNMTFRRDVLLKLGGFDEALDTGAPLPGGGDLDIFYRVIRAGFVLVYEPQYLVYHQHRREDEKLRRQYWSWGLGLMAFVMKSYQSDPLQRTQLRQLVGWWFKDQLKQLKRSLQGRHSLPPVMILAELWGGMVGLLGGYSRSLHRVEKIRNQVPQPVSGLGYTPHPTPPSTHS